MVLTAPSANDENYSPNHSLPHRGNIGNLVGKIRRYTGDNTNSQTITLSPPAQRVYEVRYFNTAAANYHDVWVALKQVSSLTGEATGYTYTEATGVILFGNGTNGYKPASGLVIEVEYEAKHVGESTAAPGNQRLQDGDGTTLADVVSARKYTMYAGTVTAYADGDAVGPPVVKSTLTDSNANLGAGWTVNEYANMLCVITEGPGRGQSATIESNTGTVLTLTVGNAFATDPTTDSSYAIVTSLNALAVLLQAGIKVDQVNVEGFSAGEYRSTLTLLANLQNAQLALSKWQALLSIQLPPHDGNLNWTYNADGTVATSVFRHNGKTITTTWTYNADGTVSQGAPVVS